MKLSEILENQQLTTDVIRRWITVGVCMVVAVVVADWVANQQLSMLAICAGVALTAFVAAGMQRSAWLLVLVGWYLSGNIYALPIPVATRDIAVLLATCAYLAHRILVGHSSRPSRNILGALVAMNCADIVLIFLKHPIGVRALGAETMGGRMYFTVFIAFCAYWVIVHLPESYKSVTRIPQWLIASTAFVAMINLAVYLFPSITLYVLPFYGAIDYTGYFHTGSAEAGVQRFKLLAPFGLMLVQVLAAYYTPRTLLNPLRWRFYLFLLGLSCLFAGGFRSMLLFAFGSLALASWFHRGWRELIVGGIVGVAFFGLLTFGQGRFYELPLTAQRALAFLPGRWAEVIYDEVKSSDSRFEWWRRVIHEGFVHNWLLGDGIGVSQQDFALLAGSNQSEWFDITGGYHNGPLSTIRYAGVLGLILFYALMIAGAIYSTECVRRCRGTPLFPVAVFLAIQLIWWPIQFTFVFGGYDSAVPEQFFLVGLLCLVIRMADTVPPPERPMMRNRLASAPRTAPALRA